MKRSLKRFFGLILLFTVAVCLLCPAFSVRTFAAGTSASSGTGGAEREKPAPQEPRENETPAEPEDETVTENVVLPEMEQVTGQISVVQTGAIGQTYTAVKDNTRPANATSGWVEIRPQDPTPQVPTVKDPTPTLPRIEIFDPTPKAPSVWRP